MGNKVNKKKKGRKRDKKRKALYMLYVKRKLRAEGLQKECTDSGDGSTNEGSTSSLHEKRREAGSQKECTDSGDGSTHEGSTRSLHDMSEVEWTNEQVINLMREYRNRPVLWDTNDNMFRVQTARYEAWSQIAEMFGCAITDMRKKINSIFASHRREKGKVRAGTRSTWFLYDHLSFLPNHVENEQGVDASVSSSKKRRLTQEETEEPFEEYLDESEIIIKEEPQELYQVRQTVYTSPEPVKHSKRRLTKQPVQECKKLPETVEVVKRSEVIQNKDECDSFGEYIAMSLRKHDERTQAMIKQAINNILFEQEMKKYSTEQYTVVISNMDENPLVDSDE